MVQRRSESKFKFLFKRWKPPLFEPTSNENGLNRFQQADILHSKFNNNKNELYCPFPCLHKRTNHK